VVQNKLTFGSSFKFVPQQWCEMSQKIISGTLRIYQAYSKSSHPRYAIQYNTIFV